MKEIRWELILMPLVSIVLGIYLIMQPGAATVALCSLIGWLILLAGAARSEEHTSELQSQ